MKQLFTLLTFLFLVLNLNAQDFDNLSPESIEDFFILENGQNSSAPQVDLRSPFGVDSSFYYELPDDVLLHRRYSTFNNLGSMIADSSIRLDTVTNVWENYRKIEIIRNPDDQLSVYDIFEWNQNNLSWTPHIKNEYSYNSDENLIEWVYKLWDSSSMVFKNAEKWEDEYDSNGVKINSYKSLWDSSSSNWKNDQNTIFTNNNHGLVIEEITQKWFSGSYNNQSKKTYEYDINQNLTIKITQTWNYAFQSWGNDKKIENAIVDNQIITKYTSGWVMNINGLFDWQFNNLIQLSYDGAGNKIESLRKEYIPNSNDWIETGKWIYFFSDLNTDPPLVTKTPKNTSLICYLQNPIRTGEIINCQGLDLNMNYNLMLFDLSGKVLLEKKIKGGVEIGLPSFLRSGMYFMNVLKDGKLVLNEKIVIID